jgi:hypothetical protein
MARSFCLKMAISPVMNAETPAANPASIVIASTGLLVISARNVSLEGTDSYNEIVKFMPMKSNIGIAMINPRDHLPKVDFGIYPPL